MSRASTQIDAMKNQQKVSLFHLLFLIGVTSTPVISGMIGWERAGLPGAVLGVLIGTPLGVLLGYLPWWLIGILLSVTKKK